MEVVVSQDLLYQLHLKTVVQAVVHQILLVQTQTEQERRVKVAMVVNLIVVLIQVVVEALEEVEVHLL